MKLWTLSDLHVDAHQSIDLGEHPGHDAIIMSGDLSDGGYDVVPWLLETFSDAERARLIYVPGNHDAYGVGIKAGTDRLRRIAGETGITVLDNDAIEIDGRSFVGTTLWSDFRMPERSWGMLGDLAYIPDFSADEWRLRHARDVDYLRSTVRPGDVVVTHHSPSLEGLGTGMRQNPRLMGFATAYATKLDDLVEELAPSLWVHGHTHVTREYVVRGVPVATNAMGRRAGLNFRSDYVVEIGEPKPRPQAR